MLKLFFMGQCDDFARIGRKRFSNSGKVDFVELSCPFQQLNNRLYRFVLSACFPYFPFYKPMENTNPAKSRRCIQEINNIRISKALFTPCKLDPFNNPIFLSQCFCQHLVPGILIPFTTVRTLGIIPEEIIQGTDWNMIFLG